MAKRIVSREKFEEIVELVREDVPQRVQLAGYPEYLEVCVKAHDPSPGRDYWIEMELVPEDKTDEADEREDEREKENDEEIPGTEGQNGPTRRKRGATK